MRYDPTHTLRCYRVNGYENKSETCKYGRHHNFGVVTSSASKAIDWIREKHPEVRIDSVNDVSLVDYVDGEEA